MRFIVLVLLLLTETSMSFAQGHMGTPQEQQACRRDAQRFCRQQLGNDGVRTMPDAEQKQAEQELPESICQPRHVSFWSLADAGTNRGDSRTSMYGTHFWLKHRQLGT